jgi:exopolyphosphatase/guanosine-5'-triphosphate,3'-diphosphate pyrophosphatase
VVDVGSNSILLTIGERDFDGWHVVHETSEVTALGEGIKSTGKLLPFCAQKTLEAIKSAFAIAESFGAGVRAYGTMALRIAENRDDFLDSAVRQGTPVTIISGGLEAELGVACVSEDPEFKGRQTSVVDVGGHSTEITSVASQSYPIGTLGLRSNFLCGESPAAGSILAASKAIDEAFRSVGPIGRNGIVVGLGASVTNLAAIRAELRAWDPAAVHGKSLTYEEVSRFVGRSMQMTDHERSELIGIEKGREKTIHIGALIVERAMLALAAEEIFVSVKGWRHAMLEMWL